MASAFKFFLITFLITWSCWIPVVVIQEPSPGLRQVLLLVGTFAPAIVALALTAYSIGKTGVTSMLSHLLQ